MTLIYKIVLPLLVFSFYADRASHGQSIEYPIQVVYLEGTISKSSDGVITLLDGSKWLKSRYDMLLPMSDVFIVLTDDSGKGIAFSDGSQMQVEHLSGQPIGLMNGLLSKVVDSMGDGAVLELADGSMWEIPSYDQFDTNFWMPPYHVIITADQGHLINVSEGKKVWAKQVR